MPLLTRRRIIAAAIEAVEGVAEAITVADAGIIAMDVKFDADFKMYDRANVALSTLSKLQPIPGPESGKISFKAELKGPGATYSATVKPEVGKFLRACGFAETVDVTTPGSETVTYLPASTGVPTLTIWAYVDGVIKKLKGCRGTVKFDGKLGEPIFATFDFTGVYGGVVDGAMITPTLEASVPPVLLGTTLTIDAFSPVCESISIDMGNQIQLRPSIGAVSGYTSALFTDRKPTGTLDPEFALVAGYDFFGKWKNGTPAALTAGPVGATQYNRYILTAPKAVFTKVGEGDRTGNQTAPLTYALAMDTGDDEVQLQFT